MFTLCKVLTAKEKIMKMNFPLHLITFNSLLYLHIVSLPAAENQENFAQQQEHQSCLGLASSHSAAAVGDNPPYRTQQLPRGTVIPQLASNYAQPPSYEGQQWLQQHHRYLDIGSESCDQHTLHPQSLPHSLSSFPPAHNPHHRRTRSRSMDERDLSLETETKDELQKTMAQQDQNATPEHALQMLQADWEKAVISCNNLLKMMETRKKELSQQLADARQKELSQQLADAQKKSISADSPKNKESFFGNLIKSKEKRAIEQRVNNDKNYEDSIKPIKDNIFKQGALCYLASRPMDDYTQRMQSTEPTR